MKKLLTTLLLLGAFFAQATTYYISTSGSDSNPGTQAAPFLTMGKAESVVQPGDQVIMTGTYSQGDITLSRSGTQAAPIEFKGPATLNISGMMTISGQYRILSGLTFVCNAVTPVLITGNNNKISGCKYSGTFTRTIFIKTAGNQLTNLDITQTAAAGYGIQVGEDAPGLGGENADNNTLDNIRIIGTVAGGAIHGVLFGGGGRGNILKNSYIAGTYYGLVDKLDTATQAFNNIFNHQGPGLYTCIYAKGSTGAQYFNNTLQASGGGYGVLMGPGDGGAPQPSGINISNNIFIKPDSDPAIFNATPSTGTFNSNFNCYQYKAGIVILNQAGTNYSTLEAWQLATFHDLQSIAATPTFANGSGTMTAKADYAPQAGSPIIDKGTAIAGRSSDALGAGLTGTPDQGAIEYQGTTTTPPPAGGRVFYVSTTGSDGNPGTITAPFKTFQKINTLGLVGGDTVYIRAGTYKSGVATGTRAVTWTFSGSAGKPVVIMAYPPDFPQGGRVVFDGSDFIHQSSFYGIDVQNCNYVTISGIRSTNFPQTAGTTGTGTITGSWWIISTSNSLIDNCEGDNSMCGFRLDDGANVTFNNCDAHHIDDPFTNNGSTGRHNNSDGFGRWNPDNGSVNTVYQGCRAWWCSDDGWDCINSPGMISYKNCWSFWNGYKPGTYPLVHQTATDTYGDGNGFKMGGPGATAGLTRFADHCIAANNWANGFDQNAGFFTAQFFNNTAYGSPNLNDWKYGYNPPIAHQFRNNLSYKCKITAGTTTDATAWTPNDHNSWNGITVTDADFVSLDDTQLPAARKPNGDLPDITFLRPTATSKLTDKGADVGMPFTGAAPEIGAFESTGTTPPPPTIYKNVAQSKSFNKNNCTSGTGSAVVYAIAAGKYTSTISQAAADQLATDDINNNGQNFANVNGTCAPRTIIKVIIFYSDGTQVTQQ